MPDVDRFLSEMHKEKLQSQERRGKLVSQKLTWVSGLFLLGSIRLETIGNPPINLVLALYLVPVIAIIFDLYISGENFGVKRMGTFIRDQLAEEFEGKWEKWLVDKRDPFSWYALPFSSAVVLVASGVLLAGAGGKGWRHVLILSVWAALNAFGIWFVYFRAGRLLGGLNPKKEPAA